jgi:hypothetical protein
MWRCSFTVNQSVAKSNNGVLSVPGGSPAAPIAARTFFNIENWEEHKMENRSNSPLTKVLPFLAILVGIIIINWFVFQYVFHENYFIWYITNGTLIGIIVSFAGSIWEGLSFRTLLLSAHPGFYIQGCFGLLAAFFKSASVSGDRDPYYKLSESNRDSVSEFDFGLDTFMDAVLKLILGILMLAWFIVVAPLNYFITIFTGSIARLELSGKYKHAIVTQTDGNFYLSSIARNEKLPEHAIDISLAAKPFAMTQAITALVLFIVNKVLIA